ncbi:MAG: MlaD family protein [Planctomycetota bacterium]|jgi:ABC-type transporter Mla subunit MlaD
MARRKRNELTAGLFVIVVLAITLGVVLWLGASEILAPTRQRAFFYAEESDGSNNLTEGSAVEINSKQIGRVVSVRYAAADRRTLYEVEIHQADAAIYADAAAEVTSGLVRESKLTITDRGTAGGPLADEKNPVHITGGFNAAMRQASDAVEKLDKFIAAELDRTKSAALLSKVHNIADKISSFTTVWAKIAANLKPETEADNQKSMIVQARQTISNIKDTTANLKRETNAKEPKSLVAKVHKTVDHAHEITADAKPKIKNMLKSAAAAAEKIEQYSKKDIPQIFAQLRKANDKILTVADDLAAVSNTTKKIIVLNRDNIDMMIDNMTQVSATLKATSEEIRANPWRLIHKPKKEDMQTYGILTAATAFSQGASSLQQAIGKLKNLDPKLIRADDPQVQKIRDHLNESFRKFKEVEDALWKKMQAKPG